MRQKDFFQCLEVHRCDFFQPLEFSAPDESAARLPGSSVFQAVRVMNWRYQISAAVMRQAFEAVGGFDEQYFVQQVAGLAQVAGDAMDRDNRLAGPGPAERQEVSGRFDVDEVCL